MHDTTKKALFPVQFHRFVNAAMADTHWPVYKANMTNPIQWLIQVRIRVTGIVTLVSQNVQVRRKAY